MMSLDDLAFRKAREDGAAGETVTHDCTRFLSIDQGHCLLDGFQRERKFPVVTTVRMAVCIYTS